MHIKYTKIGFEPLYVCEDCNLAIWWDSPMVLKLKRDDNKKRHE
jgi:predicted RNA-binding protein with PUA domain